MGRTGQFGGPQVNDHWLSVRPSTTEVLEPDVDLHSFVKRSHSFVVFI